MEQLYNTFIRWTFFGFASWLLIGILLCVYTWIELTRKKGLESYLSKKIDELPDYGKLNFTDLLVDLMFWPITIPLAGAIWVYSVYQAEEDMKHDLACQE